MEARSSRSLSASHVGTVRQRLVSRRRDALTVCPRQRVAHAARQHSFVRYNSAIVWGFTQRLSHGSTPLPSFNLSVDTLEDYRRSRLRHWGRSSSCEDRLRSHHICPAPRAIASGAVTVTPLFWGRGVGLGEAQQHLRADESLARLDLRTVRLCQPCAASVAFRTTHSADPSSHSVPRPHRSAVATWQSSS